MNSRRIDDYDKEPACLKMNPITDLFQMTDVRKTT